MNTELTEEQTKIIHRALGMKDGKRGFRNHYYTDEDTDDFAICESLVKIGIMERHKRNWEPCFIYTVTPLWNGNKQK